MNLSQLRRIIKEELLNSLKENETITKPGTKEKEKEEEKTKKRTLRPCKDAPDVLPAKAKMKENAMVKKIAQRFRDLS